MKIGWLGLINFLFLIIAFDTLAFEFSSNREKKEFFLYSAEIDNYIRLADQLKTMPEESSEEKDKTVYQLREAGTRIAKIYFSKLTTITETESPFHLYLQNAVNQNKGLKTEFLFLGNAFVDYAETTLAGQYESKLSVYTLAKAPILNFSIGTSFLLLRLQPIANRYKATKSLFSIGLKTNARMISFALGKSKPISLQVEQSIKTAEDFSKKYPRSEDFIRSLLESL